MLSYSSVLKTPGIMPLNWCGQDSIVATKFDILRNPTVFIISYNIYICKVICVSFPVFLGACLIYIGAWDFLFVMIT